MIHKGRCGTCIFFKRNGEKCPKDTKKGRGNLYANDYGCDNLEEKA